MPRVHVNTLYDKSGYKTLYWRLDNQNIKEYNSNFPTYFKAQDTSGFHFEWNLPNSAFHAMTESKVHKQNVLEENIVSVSFNNRTQLSRRQRVRMQITLRSRASTSYVIAIFALDFPYFVSMASNSDL